MKSRKQTEAERQYIEKRIKESDDSFLYSASGFSEDDWELLKSYFAQKKLNVAAGVRMIVSEWIKRQLRLAEKDLVEGEGLLHNLDGSLRNWEVDWSILKYYFDTHWRSLQKDERHDTRVGVGIRIIVSEWIQKEVEEDNKHFHIDAQMFHDEFFGHVNAFFKWISNELVMRSHKYQYEYY